jgi:hypothetical protein
MTKIIHCHQQPLAHQQPITAVLRLYHWPANSDDLSGESTKKKNPLYFPFFF